MTEQILIIIQITITAAAAIAYILTYRYLSKKVKDMEQTVATMKNLIDAQTQIIQNIESYKKLYDPEDFKKAMTFKLDNQKIEMTRFFEKEAEKLATNVAERMSKNYLDTNAKLLASFNELAQIPISIIMKQYPDKNQKGDRDKYIK